MDKLAIVRSAYHTNAGHGMGSQWMLTGYQPTIEVNDNIYPSLRLGRRQDARPERAGPAGLRQPAAHPQPRQGGLPRRVVQPVRPGQRSRTRPASRCATCKLPGRVDADAAGVAAASCCSDLDTHSPRHRHAAATSTGSTRSTATPWRWSRTPRRRRPSTSTSEPAKLREHYGRNDLGQSCLLARRLVEAGVTFVTIQAGGGWDTHGDNFKRAQEQPAAEVRPGRRRPGQRPVRPRPAERRAGDGDGRVRPHAAHQHGRRPRPLARRHVDPVRRRRPARWARPSAPPTPRPSTPPARPPRPAACCPRCITCWASTTTTSFYDQAQRPLPILSEGEPIADLIG